MIMKKTMSNRMFAFLLITPALLVILFIIVYPLLNAIFTSLFRYYLTDGRGMTFNGISNYRKMFTSPEFWNAFKNTVVYVGSLVAGELIIGLGLALLVNYKFRFKSFINTLFFVPWIIPSVVVAIIAKFLFFDHYHGIINVVLKALGIIEDFVPWLKDPTLAMPTVTIATIWKMFPFMFVMIYAGLQAIPVEEIEAATIDGANAFHRFLHITIPNIREIITLATILEFIWMFQYITIIWTTTKGGPINSTTTLPVLIYRVSFKGSMNMGYASTIGVFWLLFLLAFSILYVNFLGKREKF